MDLEMLVQQPADRPARSTPLLFVHGAWHAAWCWQEHFLPFFARAGFACYAPSLRGHGASPGRGRRRGISLRDYLDDIVAAVRSLPGEPVLIGHSMGGFLVQKYLEQFSAPGAVLVAPIPPWGAARVAVDLLRRHPAAFARANLTLSMTPLVATPALARAMFFSAATAGEDVARYQDLLQDESYRAFLDLVALDPVRTSRVRRVPMLVLGAEDDTLVSPAQVRRTGAIYGADVALFPEGAHDLMLTPGWQQVAEHILGWLRRTLPDAAGTADGADAVGTSEGADAAGTSEGADAAGTAEGADAVGTSEGADAAGTSEGADAAGTSDGADAAGTSDGADAAGTSDGADAAGTSDGADAAGTSEGADAAGTSEGAGPLDRA